MFASCVRWGADLTQTKWQGDVWITLFPALSVFHLNKSANQYPQEILVLQEAWEKNCCQPQCRASSQAWEGSVVRDPCREVACDPHQLWSITWGLFSLFFFTVLENTHYIMRGQVSWSPRAPLITASEYWHNFSAVIDGVCVCVLFSCSVLFDSLRSHGL